MEVVKLCKNSSLQWYKQQQRCCPMQKSLKLEAFLFCSDLQKVVLRELRTPTGQWPDGPADLRLVYTQRD